MTLDAAFCRDMAAAEVTTTTPTKRDKAKAAAWTALAERITPATTLLGWSGAPVPDLDQQIIGTWMARDTWQRLELGQWLKVNPDYTAFVQAHPARAADVGVPLVPHDSGLDLNGLLDEAASGNRDATYLSLGQHLAQSGPATVYARIWWEFNMRPTPADRIDRAKFAAAWRRAVPLIRAGFQQYARPGQQIRIVWCPLTDGADYAPFWPGDDLVDVVALDAYAAIWGTTVPTAATLLGYVKTALAKIADFAAAHDKPVALGEWGNWQTSGTGTTNRGRSDFPDYIDAIFDWAAANNAVYMSYFNLSSGGVGITMADTPLSLARVQARAAVRSV